MQVLELAGWALEDKVSESGHAQVGATLRQEGGELELRAPRCASGVSLLPSQIRSLTEPPSPPQAAASMAPPTPILTSSSQYLRITSRALSVISGASSTTLVKILPEGEGRGTAAEERPPGFPLLLTAA